MTKMIIALPTGVGGFAEDKDQAKKIRDEQIMPALAEDKSVVLNFAAINYSTQSFMHALLRAALHKYKGSALDKIEFKNCAPQIKSLVQLVVDYSLGGFKEADKGEKGEKTKRKVLAKATRKRSARPIKARA